CVVRNHTLDGIDFMPTSPSSLSLYNTLVADNGGQGIFIGPTGAAAIFKAVLDHVRLLNNSAAGLAVTGALAAGIVMASVTDSVAANNHSAGFNVASNTGAAVAIVMVTRSMVVGNGTGLLASGLPAFLRIGQSIVTGNAEGWGVANSGTLRSYGDNQ